MEPDPAASEAPDEVAQDAPPAQVRRWTRSELDAFRGETIGDLIGPGCRLLLVGVNPGLMTVATQMHFAHPTNRFWPALRRAGLIDRTPPPNQALSEDDRAHVIERGIGITNLVARATARAAEITTTELRAGLERLTATAEEFRPRVVAITGITAYRATFADPGAQLGAQDRRIGPAVVWALPNTSGLNANHSLDSLADHYRAAADAAGLVSTPSTTAPPTTSR